MKSQPASRAASSHPATRILGASLCAIALASGPAIAADDDDIDNIGVFFRFGGTVRLGVKAEVRDSLPPVTHGAGAFDNGFVKPDISGSTSSTWNWGFNSQTQLSEGRMTLNKTDGAPRVGDLGGLSDSTLFGGELIGGFEMVRARIGKRDVRFGFEVGYGYAPFSAKASATATSTATYTTAVYDLGGIIPPSTPSYAGTYDKNGPVIDLNPLSSNSVQATGTATLTSALDADLHTLKVGPWFEVPITKHLLVGGSFGLASIYATADLSLNEAITYAGGAIPAPAVVNTHVTRNDWRPGAYLQMRLTYEFDRHWGVFVGGDTQWNRDLHFNGTGRDVKLKFEGTYGGTAGVAFRF